MDSDTHTPIGLVLIHGAELGAWLWERTVAVLAHPTVAVDLPGRDECPAPRRTVTLEDAVDLVAHRAQAMPVDRVVVVAHSFSGILIPPVVERLGPKVAAAVFVAATVPEEDRSWVDLLPPVQRAMLRLMYRVRPDGLLSPAKQNRATLCSDLDEPTTDAFLAQRVPEAPRLLLDPVAPATLPAALPRHYVRLTADRSLSPEAQRSMIDRLPDVQIHDLASGHLPMLSQPEQLAAILTDVAQTAAAPSAASDRRAPPR